MSDKPKGFSFTRFLFLLLVVAAAACWVFIGTVHRRHVQNAYYDDFVIAREAERHPLLARLVAPEAAVQAAEEFAADYDNLQSSNFITAPIYVVQTQNSHKRLAAALGNTKPEQQAPPTPTAPGPGLRVTYVEPGSTVHRNGLRVGDRIAAVDGEAIYDRSDHGKAYKLAGWGRFDPVPVTLTVTRDGQTLRIQGQTKDRGYETE